jgi:hypothetical protein
MFKNKNKLINIFLYVLIVLESIYIALVYVPIYGNQGYVAAIFYSLMAVVHMHIPSKNLTTIVFIVSVSIAIPRLFITIESKIEERKLEYVNSIKTDEINVPTPIQPMYSDCNKFASWQGDKIDNCNRTNQELQKDYLAKMDKFNTIKNDLHDLKGESKNRFLLTLSDIGGIIMFCIISASLPLMIFFLLLESEKIHNAPEVPGRRATPMDTQQLAIKLYYDNIPVADIINQLGISKTTLYKYVKAKK